MATLAQKLPAGAAVERSQVEALAARVAAVETSEKTAARGDQAILEQLVDFTIARDFPHLDGPTPDKRAAWFMEVCTRTAKMIVEWMRVGFVHGVMNTDNMSVLGLTIDYGPYGWLDDFDPNWTPNTTDAGGRRYRFGAQEQIAYWNLARFGEALVPVMPSVDPLHAGMDRFVAELSRVSRLNIAAKLGLRSCSDDDVALMHDLQGLLYKAEVDMTIAFRRLADLEVEAPSLDILETRLRQRATDAVDVIERRLLMAKLELAQYSMYDYLVVNDQLDRAYDEMRSVYIASHLTTRRASRHAEALLAALRSGLTIPLATGLTS